MGARHLSDLSRIHNEHPSPEPRESLDVREAEAHQPSRCSANTRYQGIFKGPNWPVTPFDPGVTRGWIEPWGLIPIMDL